MSVARDGRNTSHMLSQVLGGVGLFLVGMVLATDGLRAAAGDSLRQLLLRFTGGPMQALVSGAFATALVQSSSATTVATISFVTAGLLSFQQALGLILGANVGTTATGWIVALLGLKFSVSTVALPLVGVGALTRLFGRGRWKDIGLALAGFGVLFVGLDTLQSGMAGASDYFTPQTLPPDTWAGRLMLVGIGILLTAVMQSSSAGIATALTALHAGTISMMQAAAMAIGINIGTTVTAGLAVIGAGTAARRTGFAHLLFNVLTGAVAFLSLPVLVTVLEQFDTADPTLALAAFHTVFNVVGVVLVYPFLRRFAAYVERVIPERGPHLTRRLVPTLADEGGLALEAVRLTVFDVARQVVDAATKVAVLHAHDEEARVSLDECRSALDATNAFIASLKHLSNVGADAQSRHVNTIHALDHLDGMVDMLRREADLLLHDAPGDGAQIEQLAAQALAAAAAWLEDPLQRSAPIQELAETSTSIAAARKSFRNDVLERAARGDYDAVDAARDIDLIRRLDELSYFLSRFVSRMGQS